MILTSLSNSCNFHYLLALINTAQQELKLNISFLFVVAVEYIMDMAYNIITETTTWDIPMDGIQYYTIY